MTANAVRNGGGALRRLRGSADLRTRAAPRAVEARTECLTAINATPRSTAYRGPRKQKGPPAFPIRRARRSRSFHRGQHPLLRRNGKDLTVWTIMRSLGTLLHTDSPQNLNHQARQLASPCLAPEPEGRALR